MILSFSWASIIFDLLCMGFCFWGTLKVRAQLKEVRIAGRRYREEMTRNFETYQLTVARSVFAAMQRLDIEVTDDSVVNGITYKEVREYFEEGGENNG